MPKRAAAAGNKRLQGNGLVAPKAPPSTALAKAKKKKKLYFASIFPPSPTLIPDKLGRLIQSLENEFRQPIWIMIQNPPSDRRKASPYDEIDFPVFKAFQ